MNRLYQYDPYTGGQSLPAYGSQYQNDGLLNALFRDLTRQQILGAFTPRGQGGQSSAFLDMLMNGLPQQTAPVAAPAPAAPVAAPVPAEPDAELSYQQSIERGGDSYSPFGGDAISGPSVVSYGPNGRGGWDVTNSAGVTTTTHANGAQTTSGGGGGGGK